MKRPAFVHIASAVVGVATTMLGPLMPALESRWHLDDAQAGLFFTAQFLASVGFAAAVGPLVARYGFTPVLSFGLVLVAAGTAACNTGVWPVALAAVAVYGCGLGLFIPAANMAIASENPGRSARSVMWLNLNWSIGAVTAPALILLLRGAFLWALAAAAAAACLVILSQRSRVVRARETYRTFTRPPGLTLLFCAFMFVYVGAETSVAGWVSAYALRTMEHAGLWTMLPSVFWGALLAGRLAAQSVLRGLAPGRLVFFGLAIGTVGIVMLVAARSGPAFFAATAISGLGFAPIFPLLVAQYSDLTGAHRASGLIFSAAGLGGSAIPPMIGYLSTATGSLRLALSVVLIGIGLMAWMQSRVLRGRM